MTYNEFITTKLEELAEKIAKQEYYNWYYTLYNGYCEIDDIKNFIVGYLITKLTAVNPENNLTKFDELSQLASAKNKSVIAYIRNEFSRNSRRDFREKSRKNRVIITEVDIPYTSYYGEGFMDEISDSFTTLDDGKKFAKLFAEYYDVSNTKDKKANKKSDNPTTGLGDIYVGKVDSTYERLEYIELWDYITSHLPKKYQIIIGFKEAGYTDVYIAKEMGVSRQQLYNYLNEIKESLEVYIKENGITYDD